MIFDAPPCHANGRAAFLFFLRNVRSEYFEKDTAFRFSFLCREILITEKWRI